MCLFRRSLEHVTDLFHCIVVALVPPRIRNIAIGTWKRPMVRFSVH